MILELWGKTSDVRVDSRGIEEFGLGLLAGIDGEFTLLTSDYSMTKPARFL